MWFKMKHGKTTCDANRPKDLEEYGFEVPERLRETLDPVLLPQMQLWLWLTHQEKSLLTTQTGRLSPSVNLSL